MHRKTPRSCVESLESRVMLSSTVTQTIDHSHGFANASGLMLNGLLDSGASSPATITNSHLRLADGTRSQHRSAFTTSAFPIATFSTTFTFQFTAQPVSSDGMTFTVQSKSPGALGGGGGGLGYFSVPNSVAVKFDLYQNASFGDPSNNCTGLFTDGQQPTGGINLTPSGVNLHAGDLMRATLAYNGTTLTETLTDTKTNKIFTHGYGVNIPSLLGSNFGYVGFSAGSGGNPITQDIVTWTFTGTSPSSSTVAGRVFNDTNGNGKLDASEKGLAGWIVYVDANNDGQFEPNETYVTTDSAGNFKFTFQKPGTYVLRVQARDGFYHTSPHTLSYTITLVAGSVVTSKLFGVRAIAPV